MKSIPTIKILTSISFLLVLMPNEKSELIICLGLIFWFIGLAGPWAILIGISVSIALLYLLVSAFKKSNTKNDCKYSILSLLALYVPIAMLFERIIMVGSLLAYISYITFLVISFSTFISLINRWANSHYKEYDSKEKKLPLI